ncbi:hypothetical protein HGA88_02975 [Candidatus Roizmanbacteria bacterium]|nr:hypothetical protein [Candidatus Roizmanbacteria bacterium]
MIANTRKKTSIFRILTLILGISFALLFFTVLILGNYIVFMEKKLSSSLYPGVFIDKQEVGYKTAAQLKKEYQAKYAYLQNKAFTIRYKDQPVATLSAEKINLHSNANEIVDRAYLVGRTPHIPTRVTQKLLSLLHLSTFQFSTYVTYDKNSIDEVLGDLEDRFNQKPKDALFTFENGKVKEFSKDEPGLRIKSNMVRLHLERAVFDVSTNPQASTTITLEDEVIQPEITLAKANNFGIEELIGEGVSNFTHSIPSRIYNVNIASSKFNGVLIEKDKDISFNQIVGEISARTGYQPAYIIQNGRTVLGDGGGVCQVSTTLFRAAMNAGLPILERHAHAYRVGYYENDSKPGFDATVYSPTVDLRIKNDTGAAILILTEIDKDKNLLYFRLYGKKDGRKSEISEPVISDQAPPLPAVYQDDPTLKKGVTKQVDYPAWGAKSVFNYKITYATNKIEEQKFVSVYKPWAPVYLVGTAD